MATFLDDILSGVGLSTRPADEAIEGARDLQLTGLQESFDLGETSRDDFLARFDEERQRILNQTFQDRQTGQAFNDAALGQLPIVAVPCRIPVS